MALTLNDLALLPISEADRHRLLLLIRHAKGALATPIRRAVDQELVVFLTSLSLQQYADLFRSKGVSYATLLTLSAEELRQMNVPSGVAIKIAAETTRRRVQTVPTPTPTPLKPTSVPVPAKNPGKSEKFYEKFG